MEQTIILGDVNITYLLKAASKFKEILQLPKNEITRDAAIQRFEFTYELVWKTLKRILSVKGITVNNPRDVFREGGKQNLISNVEAWFKIIEYRNKTTNVYNEDMADEIYAALSGINDMIQKFIVTCISLEKS